MPRPPPRSSRVTAKPARAQFEDQLGDAPEGPAERRQIEKLRADMHRNADWLDAGQRSGKSVGLDRVVDVDAELVFFLSGRDLGVGQRIDIGIDPDRDLRGRAARRGDRAQADAVPASTRH